jgi:hypothetical protein
VKTRNITWVLLSVACVTCALSGWQLRAEVYPTYIPENGITVEISGTVVNYYKSNYQTYVETKELIGSSIRLAGNHDFIIGKKYTFTYFNYSGIHFVNDYCFVEPYMEITETPNSEANPILAIFRTGD